ncbi:MAG TPA: nicotinamide-nucleotide adenylyltransferase [Patescibacteria group bacterium]|nr:nicotinamide-nucleotide adenylyltransferase [Patescibacteria group bacterium]
MKANKNKKCLIVGRFQPFHNGHLYVVQKCLENFKKVIIGVGSSQDDYTLKNPMTFYEREEMIERFFSSHKIKKTRYSIISLPDIATNSLWADYVAKRVGKFDEVVTASPFTKLLFMDSGYRVSEHSLYQRKKYSGTEIRNRILKHKNWEALVPLSTYTYLNKCGIPDRIRELLSTDNPYL